MNKLEELITKYGIAAMSYTSSGAAKRYEEELRQAKQSLLDHIRDNYEEKK